MSLVIRVAEGDWGGARTVDVHAVVRSTAACFLAALDPEPLLAVTIEPTASGNDVPMTLSTTNEVGDFVVRVNIRGNRWARLAYQFSHEFCHVLADPRTWIADRFAWVEEALCETASLFALRCMATSWQSTPPYPNWRDYSVSLGTYAAERISDAAHSLPAGVQFRDWLVESLPLLEGDPLRRTDNTIMAKELLPVFESHPIAWGALCYLHVVSRPASATYADVLREWCMACPPASRVHVESICAVLGVA